MLRTARQQNRPPSAWLFGGSGEWTGIDHLLTLTLTIWEDGLCSCGNPTAVAHHPDNDGEYDAEKRQCHACAAVERASNGKQQPEPGTKFTPVYTRTKPLGPWPSL